MSLDNQEVHIVNVARETDGQTEYNPKNPRHSKPYGRKTNQI